jgi:hypothetical protein
VTTIRNRERDALLHALRAGVVPRVGQHLIQVGRSRELEALLADMQRISEGGATFRLIIGEYGSGKTFFLNLVRAVGLEKKLVVSACDLNPDRRLHATGGQARSLYAELMRNISTRTKPDGGALPAIVEKFVASVASEARKSGTSANDVIHQRLDILSELVGGYDFATVIAAYWEGFDSGRDELKSNAIRWLRGEFSTRTDARKALGVRTFIDDAAIYDQLKLLARFVRLAGYSGLLICLDELVNLYKLANTQARNSNYEQILRILNDVLQNPPQGLGFVLGGTPDFLLDTRRGLYSYEALQSRLAENTFARDGLVDFTGPVIRLAALSPEEYLVLLHNIRNVFAFGDRDRYLVNDNGVMAFMRHCHSRLGESYFRTPRTTIKEFVNLLAILEQNPGANWPDLVGSLQLEADTGESSAETGGSTDDDLSSFRL